MNVLFLTQRLPYATNRGDRIRAHHLLHEMSRFAAVSLLSLVHDDDEQAQVDRVPFAEHVRAVRVPRFANLVRGALRLPSARPLTHSLLDAPHISSELTGMIQRAPPQVVVALCSSMARFALEPPLAGLPLVIDMIDVDSVKWTDLAGSVRPPMRWIYQREATTLRRFERVAVRAAAATLVVNERERDALLGIEPSARVVVMQIGVDLAAFTPPGPPAAAPTVVFCGVLNYAPNRNGVRWFAETVWPTVRSVRPDAKFLVVGANPPPEILELGKRDSSIEVAGSVPAVQPYLWRSAVAIAPLQIARGVQNKVLEALAAGLPSVVTPEVWGGLPPEALPGCIVAGDPRGFADAVVHLLRLSPEERRRIALSASVDQLTWSHHLAPLEGILRRAAASAQSD